MSIGKIKMKGTKPVMEVTRPPKGTEEFEKVEIPNKKVSKALAKMEAKYGVEHSWEEQKNLPSPTDKEFHIASHFDYHVGKSADYGRMYKKGMKPEDIKSDGSELMERYKKGYTHYVENVDADKKLYDWLMGTTGGNGEHNK